LTSKSRNIFDFEIAPAQNGNQQTPHDGRHNQHSKTQEQKENNTSTSKHTGKAIRQNISLDIAVNGKLLVVQRKTMLLNNGSSALRGLSRRSSNHVTDENAMSSTANRMKGASTPGRNPSKKGLSVSNENEVSFSVPSGKGLSSNLQGNKTPATARRRAFGDISNRKLGRNEGSTNNGNGGRGLGDNSALKQSKSKFVTFQTPHQSNKEARGGVNNVRAPGSSHRTSFSNMSAKKSASKNIMTPKESLRTKEFVLPQRATFLEPTPRTVKSRNKGVSNSSRNTTETQQLESVESIEDVEYPAGRLG
jgi:hypothetical protein